jgi:hypothetical protein
MYDNDKSTDNRNTVPRMNGAAIVRVKRPSGRVKCFVAETCEVNGPWVSATGTWRGEQRRETIIWPSRSILELRFEARR